MKFIMSYSGGKDSILALHRLVGQGHQPVGLLVMFHEEAGRSWFHGIDPPLLQAIAKALDLPLFLCGAAGDAYHLAMEECLIRAKSLGAEACAFGDIDIEAHRQWDEARCAATGLEALLPLWQRGREENAREAVALGYRCLIKCINRDVLPERFLGRELSVELLEEMKRLGIDLCGENGEYHTVVVDGPLFLHPVACECRETLRFGKFSAINLIANREE